ncbi:HD domain-containing protein [Arenicella xantha]|uniref:Putative HD phosphohydrolase n=1 Tax=Arenicella xantha TaxID=644221 RepID=A0A395JQH9_9GAMM|nr:HD domain-containing protein [Arenicella xantha]RBP52815.1 putative HD phosphohydrolase [Arenicella xantha]
MQTKFHKMSDSTAEDWQLIMGEQLKFFTALPDRLLTHLELLSGDYGGFPVDRLQHSLQTAELAAEAGEDEQYVVCALLHDIGDTLGSANHADVAAAILEPFVSDANHWMIKHHAVVQGYNFFHYIGMDRNLRDSLRDHPYYPQTERFVNEYDDLAFDARKPTLSLTEFEPMVRRVFAKPLKSLYKSAL